MLEITKMNNNNFKCNKIENNFLFSKHQVENEIIIDTINQLPLIEEALLKDGYVFSNLGKNAARFVFTKATQYILVYIGEQMYTKKYLDFLKQKISIKQDKNIVIYLNRIDEYIYANYDLEKYLIKKPDFNNSLVNLASSFMKKFGRKSDYQSISYVDELIKDYNKVTLFLLDGLGINILNNLDEKGFFRKNLVYQMTSIFPPTTVAATTCLQSGVLPGESGWVGWTQYFKETDENIVLFKNEDHYTGKSTNIDTVNDAIGYTPYYESFKNSYKLMPSFIEGGYEDLPAIVNEVIKISHKKEKSFTYAYWDAPDRLIHEFGCYSDEVKKDLREVEKQLEILESSISEDSCVLVIADHGLLDVFEIHLKSFDSLKGYLTLKPSVEGRSCNFSVNDKEGFKNEFNKYFSHYFDLLSHQEFLDSGLLGKHVIKGERFIGDFIAIAKSNYYINSKNEPGRFIAAHAGLTSLEMEIPIILIKKRTV